MTKIFFILSLTLSLTTAAQAYYFKDRLDWERLPISMKQAYAAGVFEGLITDTKLEESYARIDLNTTLIACVMIRNITIGDLVDMIDSYYLDVGNWKQEPMQALRQSLTKTCSD